MANDNSTEIPSTTDDNPRRPNFCILLDPPDTDWWRSSSAMIYCLQSHAEFIAQTNPIEARPEELATLLQAIVSPLLLITDELTDRMNEGYTANDAVRDYLTSDEYTAKIEKRSGGES